MLVIYLMALCSRDGNGETRFKADVLYNACVIEQHLSWCSMLLERNLWKLVQQFMANEQVIGIIQW